MIRKVVLLTWACLLPGAGVEAEIYQYDSVGRITDVIYEDGSIVRYSYDDNSNITQVQLVQDNLFEDGFES